MSTITKKGQVTIPKPFRKNFTSRKEIALFLNKGQPFGFKEK